MNHLGQQDGIPTQDAMHQNLCLQPRNTMALPSKARFFCSIATQMSWQSCHQHPMWSTLPHYIIGAGSNVLPPPFIPGWVIQSGHTGITITEEDQDHVYLTVGAAENWHDLVLYTLAHGWSGLENLALIPGTVGAAPVQNIGAYGVEVSERMTQLTTLDLTTGATQTWLPTQCGFGYRDSCFKHAPHRHNTLITTVTFRLDQTFTPVLHYRGLQAALNDTPITAQAVAHAVMQIRCQKLPDPSTLPNSGSFFKNPVVKRETWQHLAKQFPHMPHHTLEEPSLVKLSAAWMIEQCGLRGTCHGPVGTHVDHALVLVNHGDATLSHVRQFSEHVTHRVWQTFGVQLEPEVLPLCQ